MHIISRRHSVFTLQTLLKLWIHISFSCSTFAVSLLAHICAYARSWLGVSVYFMSIYVAPQYTRTPSYILHCVHRSDCIKCHGAVFIRSLVVRCVSSWRHSFPYCRRNDRIFFLEKYQFVDEKWLISWFTASIFCKSYWIDKNQISNFFSCNFYLFSNSVHPYQNTNVW